ncbi:CoA pyrophosphatase [Roseomonas sp. OT10]|uniref:CoA pyrophosphatase n=1 Tax=Roseomonas cutis TaxID=2897332 RepID=UPI001E3E9BE9|nr:CoA pyrophosphatase [Roseomonas sp. OT10]UFN50907.1 CoA pyrophosphatase [Roseomonas sp. OT10]
MSGRAVVPVPLDEAQPAFLGAQEVARRLVRALGEGPADPDRPAALHPSTSPRAEGLEPAPGERAERRAAVLVPVVLGERPSVLLTLRAATLSSHAGQVAFPGGGIEAGETPEAAAVREAAEEVGLDPRLPEIVGRLPEHRTGTGFHVTPVVALLHPPLVLTPDPGEVAEAFELDLAVLLDPAQPQRRARLVRGLEREFWVWPHPRHLIWGATAAMLRNLALVLRDSPETGTPS